MSDGLQMKYFVLKPKGNDPYAMASRAGMRQYAKSILEENPALAKDLRDWTDRESIEPFEAIIGSPLEKLTSEPERDA